jgi:hypothetical protein
MSFVTTQPAMLVAAGRIVYSQRGRRALSRVWISKAEPRP